MPTDPKARRFMVSDLGFAFAVHDTQESQDYGFPAGRDKEHASTNDVNGRRVEICATRAEAQRVADALNERARAGRDG